MILYFLNCVRCLPLPEAPREVPVPADTILLMDYLQVPVPADTILLMDYLQASPITASQIKTWTDRDPVLSKLHKIVVN